MTTLKVICEKTSKRENVYIKSDEDVSSLMSFLKEEDRENFYVLHLNAKNIILGKELISIGSLTNSIIHPREVFKGAILNNSASIICVHNHPSGDPSPSEEDIAITHRLLAAADIIGIEILDHVIIGNGRCFGLISEGGLRREIKEPVVLDSQKKRKAKKADKKPINVLEFEQNKSKRHEEARQIDSYITEHTNKVQFILCEGTFDEKAKLAGTILALFDEICNRKRLPL